MGTPVPQPVCYLPCGPTFCYSVPQGRGELLCHRAQGWALLLPNALCPDSPCPQENKQTWEHDCGFQQLGREDQGEPEGHVFIDMFKKVSVNPAVLLLSLCRGSGVGGALPQENTNMVRPGQSVTGTTVILTAARLSVRVSEQKMDLRSF